jgi:serine/threonine protein kinase
MYVAFHDPSPLAISFRAGYRWLYEEVKTIHRDISVSNLMLHRIEGKLYGVLNDFDLALRLSEGEPLSTSKHWRTGTKPYMAIDLLVSDPPYHLYRHDLESFLYVLVFLTCRTEGSSLSLWKHAAMEDLRDKKNTAILDGFPPTHDHFEQFLLQIIGITGMFREGFFKRSVHRDQVKVAVQQGGSVPSFKEETLGDSVTFDKFAGFLKTPIIHS